MAISVTRSPRPSHIDKGSCAESTFLLAAIRAFFDHEAVLPASGHLDWQRLAGLSERHGVTALCSHAIQDRDDISAAVRDLFRDRTRGAAFFDLTLSSELAAILGSFEAFRIASITLKGPALAVMLYGDAALRRSTDLDLLVHSRDVALARKQLESRGYSLASTLPWSGEQACLRRRDAQMSFCRQAGRDETLWVDLHWRLLPSFFPHSFDESEAWTTLRSVPVSGAFAPVLSPENLLLFLAAHGAKHTWDRLSWVCDIARLIQVEPHIDWALVFHRAVDTGTRRILILALFVASELLGTAIPVSRSYIGEEPEARMLAEKVRLRFLTDVRNPPSAIETARFCGRAFERNSQRVRFVFGIFVQPTEAEYMAFRLPPFLYWFYYLVRPVRLLLKYARRHFAPEVPA